jgi:hypothetical protein
MLGRSKEPPEESKDPKPLPEIDPDSNDEVLRVASYRTLGLLDLGFNLEQTLRIVHIADVVHTAEALLKRGAPHEYVVDELTE